MDRPGAALYRCTLFPSLIKLKSGKVVSATSFFFSFGRERENVQVPTKYYSLDLHPVSFVIAYSITDSSVDMLVGFNHVFYSTEVGETTCSGYTYPCIQWLRYGLRGLDNK